MHIYKHTHIYVYVYTYTYVYICIHTHTHAHTRTHAHTHTKTCPCLIAMCHNKRIDGRCLHPQHIHMGHYALTCAMTPSYVPWLFYIICAITPSYVPWLIHKRHNSSTEDWCLCPQLIHMYHDSCIYGTTPSHVLWLIHLICAKTPWYASILIPICHDSQSDGHTWVMSCLIHICHDLFICIMTHSYVPCLKEWWQIPARPTHPHGPWVIHMCHESFICAMTPSCVSWLICVCRDSRSDGRCLQHHAGRCSTCRVLGVWHNMGLQFACFNICVDQWVMAHRNEAWHILTSCDTHDESWHAWISHGTHEWVMAHMNKPSHIWHIRMSHVCVCVCV